MVQGTNEPNSSAASDDSITRSGDRTSPGPDAASSAAPTRSGRGRRLAKRLLLGLLALVLVVGLVGYFGRWEYAYIPGEGKALNEAIPIPGLAFDIWGRDVSADEAERLR